MKKRAFGNAQSNLVVVPIPDTLLTVRSLEAPDRHAQRLAAAARRAVRSKHHRPDAPPAVLQPRHILIALEIRRQLVQELVIAIGKVFARRRRGPELNEPIHAISVQKPIERRRHRKVLGWVAVPLRGMTTIGFSAFDQLYVYSGTRGRETFVLQHVVDTQCAQFATVTTKPIAVVFALIGLFLHVEKNYTGLQVQHVHMRLGRRKHVWPTIVLPDERGTMTADDVLRVPAGAERDAAISEWCRSVWAAYSPTPARQQIVDLLREHQIIA